MLRHVFFNPMVGLWCFSSDRDELSLHHGKYLALLGIKVEWALLSKLLSELLFVIKNFNEFLKVKRVHKVESGLICFLGEVEMRLNCSNNLGNKSASHFIDNLIADKGSDVFLLDDCDYLGERLVHDYFLNDIAGKFSVLLVDHLVKLISVDPSCRFLSICGDHVLLFDMGARPMVSSNSVVTSSRCEADERQVKYARLWLLDRMVPLWWASGNWDGLFDIVYSFRESVDKLDVLGRTNEFLLVDIDIDGLGLTGRSLLLFCDDNAHVHTGLCWDWRTSASAGEF